MNAAPFNNPQIKYHRYLPCRCAASRIIILTIIGNSITLTGTVYSKGADGGSGAGGHNDGGGGHGDNDRKLDGRFVESVPEQHFKANQSGKSINQDPDPIPHPFIHTFNGF